MNPYKIIAIIGDTSVGKSAILDRYQNDCFKDNYQPTVGISSGAKFEEECSDGRVPMRWQVYEFGGTAKDSIREMYQKIDAFVIVLDLCNPWCATSLSTYTSITKNKPTVVVGNKSDLPDEQKRLDLNDIKTFANSHEFKFFLSSAKTGVGINEAFQRLIQELDPTYEPSEVTRIYSKNVENNSNQETQENNNTTPQSKCCILL